MYDFYHRMIVEPGKQPLFLLLTAFVVTFLFIRFSVRMIRAEVSWWPGNVNAGDTHVHHVVFGVVFMLLAGIGAFTPVAGDSPWWEILAMVFGMGAALVLDEFALILHLRDVYWSEEGRKSVDAVILGAAVTGLLILGALPFGINGLTFRQSVALWELVATLVLNIVAVGVTFLKGRFWLGVLGVFVPLFALAGALRVGKPTSPWARWHYPAGSKKATRAQRQLERHDARWTKLKIRIFDAIAGRPDSPAGIKHETP